MSASLALKMGFRRVEVWFAYIPLECPDLREVRIISQSMLETKDDVFSTNPIYHN